MAARLRAAQPTLTLDRMVERLVVTSQAGHEPKRLIAGLRLAFGPEDEDGAPFLKVAAASRSW